MRVDWRRQANWVVGAKVVDFTLESNRPLQAVELQPVTTDADVFLQPQGATRLTRKLQQERPATSSKFDKRGEDSRIKGCEVTRLIARKERRINRQNRYKLTPSEPARPEPDQAASIKRGRDDPARVLCRRSQSGGMRLLTVEGDHFIGEKLVIFGTGRLDSVIED